VIETEPEDGVPDEFELAAVAVLFTVPQVAEVVTDVMWTCFAPLAAMLPKLQLIDCAPSAPEIVQPASDAPASTTQWRPAFVGSVSETETPLAVPLPPLVTVMT
jgi:hypothetical protein